MKSSSAIIHRALMASLAAAVVATAACSAKPKPEPAASATKPAPEQLSASAATPRSGEATPASSTTSEALPTSLDEINRRGYLKDVYFDYDQYQIRPDQRAVLATDADWLRRWPAIRLRVEGHCDERGTEQYNLALGEKRASEVKDYLSSLGISAKRVELVSFGKERPFVSGHDESSWSQNRRDHFVVTAR